ncbi:hypothetical protein HK405_005766, partial [Cladochytrium tenue]
PAPAVPATRRDAGQPRESLERKKVPGRRMLSPPGGSSAKSLAEFVGALEINEKPDVKKIDPASARAAGTSSGKHRVY